MAYFADLTPCTYFGGLIRAPLLAVGWLEQGHDYRHGDPGPDVDDRLREFRQELWQPVVLFGGQFCQFCRYPESYSFRNLFVPGPGVTYVAPEGIIHYVACHDYRPPEEFCTALIASPIGGSPEYFAALQASGWPPPVGRPTLSARGSVGFARGSALVEAIDYFRSVHGRLPQSLEEAVSFIDSAGPWQYVVQGRGYTLQADWSATHGFVLRYDLKAQLWRVDAKDFQDSSRPGVSLSDS